MRRAVATGRPREKTKIFLSLKADYSYIVISVLSIDPASLRGVGTGMVCLFTSASTNGKFGDSKIALAALLSP
jgi:hypothetical protein